MPKLTVDGMEVEVPSGSTVLQACEAAGVEIPRFCYHERLTIAGNCRMCLVEVKPGPPKPQASCALPAADGQEITTNSPKIRKAREGVLEFLLINHPLDCPICDQGGECDLQDQTMAYGADSSRYLDNKRAVPEKYLGPLIKTFMNRCIHCTRCIRFLSEVAGVPELGATGRGEEMEITTYIGRALSSELSANVIDLCPVGALTSRPYAFAARPWELRKAESVDVMDAVGSAIRVDVRGRDVMRILPRMNDDVNEEWISDKTRYACDGLRYRRLDRPFIRREGRLAPARWDEALAAAADVLDKAEPRRVAAIVGDQCDAESMLALKLLMAQVGTPNVDCRQDGAALDAGSRAGYLFNTTIAGIDQADAILIVGSNPRIEAPIVNARIRKRWLTGGLRVGVIGPQADLTYDYDYIGAGSRSLLAMTAGDVAFAEVLHAAQRPMVILGQGALTGSEGAAVLAAVRGLAETANVVREGWNGFNVLHTAAARVGALDLGLVPGEGGRDVAAILEGAGKGEVDVVYLLAADEIDVQPLKNCFVIYQGHHGDRGASVADVILPGAAYTEKEGTYVNTEGRVQLGRMGAFPPGEAREDWKILRALSGVLGRPLPFDTLKDVRRRLVEENPVFAAVGSIQTADWGPFGTLGELVDERPYASPVVDFYMTDPISRASKTMAECTELRDATAREPATGTAGDPAMVRS
ncbi:MAG: NADH-quinone oxidoreductase subunit NuoG [Alphaproteobacteria bacterium]